MTRRFVGNLAVLAFLFVATEASAADVWTDPAPGIRQLIRTAPGPLRFVAVTIDISRPEYFIRVTRPDERARTTSSWANQVGAVVAINGDWSDGSQPFGLSVGDDQHWPGTADNGWAFLACTLEKRCVFDDHPTNQERHHLWREVVGGNGWRLLIDGNPPAYPNEAFYNSDRHPRSGVGLSADGNTMIFAVVEGRRSDSIGLNFPDFANFFKELGAHNAMMLDGGGSSTVVVNGARQNQLPSGSGERVVANHLGILRGTPDASCAAMPNGRTCNDSVIRTCQGGEDRGTGDCGAFGASCEVTADGVGVCVHPFCTGGANGSYCEDASMITTCDYGAPGGTGDCAAFGASCETGEENSYCVHYLCSEGGNAQWCRDETTAATCVDGTPAEDTDCASQGLTCVEGVCVDPDMPPATNNANNANNPVTNNATTAGGGGNSSTGSQTNNTGTDGGDDGDVSAEGRTGCMVAAGGEGDAFALLLAVGWLRRRRRVR